MNFLILLTFSFPIIILFKKYASILQQQYYEASRYFQYLKENKWKIIIFITFISSVFILELLILEISDYSFLLIPINTSLLLLLFKKAIIKIKVTNKIKRLFVVHFVINYIVLSSSYFIFSLNIAVISMIVLTIISFLIVLLSLIIIGPYERKQNKRFVQEAQNRLGDQKDLIIIGITGSYGKTTVKNIVDQLINTTYHTLATPKSINTLLGLTRVIREQLQFTHQVFIAELGVDKVGGMDKLLTLIKPDIAIVNTIGPQHLSTFKSIENIQKEKTKLLKAVDAGGFVIINSDEPLLNNLENIKADIIYYGIDNQADIQAQNIRYSSTYMSFDLIYQNQEFKDVKSMLLGRHHLYNLLAGISIAIAIKVPIEKIIERIKLLRPAPHRLQISKSGNDTIIDDSYNSNYQGFSEALMVLKQFNTYKVLVTPGLVEQGQEWYKNNYNLAKHIAESADCVILVNKKNTEPILAGLHDLGYQNFQVVNKLSEAKKIIETMNQEKVVLFENDLPDIFITK